MNNNLFQLAFPDGWKETTVYTFEGPHDSGLQHNLIVVVDQYAGKDCELKEYVHGQLATTSLTLPGYELVNEKEFALPDGCPALLIVYKYVPAENTVLFQKQVFVKKADSVYIFTATFNKKTLQTIANDIDQIISSFRIFEAQ
jgi:hypothetical protein